MKTGMKLCSLLLMLLAGASALIFTLSSGEENEPAVTASIMVYLETTVTSAVPAVTTASSVTAAAASVNEIEEVHEEDSGEMSAAAEFPLDINTASFDELIQIPGIGEATASNIIAYRQAVGGFRSFSQLLEVSGIGEGRYERISSYIYISADMLAAETHPPEESAPPEAAVVTTEWVPVVLDVNEASAEDFDYLPGIDRELAENIVELRQKIGGFTNKLELLYADGMTDELYISIMDYLVCSAEDDG